MRGALCFLKMKCISTLLIRSCRHLLISRLMFHPSDPELVTSSFDHGCKPDTERLTGCLLPIDMLPVEYKSHWLRTAAVIL